MTQDMRHEFPVSINGATRHTNGSSPPPQKNRFTNGTNGHGPSADDVSSTYTNGHSPSKSRQRDTDFFGHNREEVTRLLIQGLEDLGYNDAAERLCQESGYRVESQEVIAFRHAILEGKWSDAESLLFGRAVESDDGGVRISNGHTPGPTHLKLVEDADEEEMKFLVREQKYVELLRRNLKGPAINVLQTELQPLNYDARRLNALSGLLVSQSSDNQDWSAIVEGRQKLLVQLSKSVSPSAMIPQHRLADLLHQVHRGQIARCLYHNPSRLRPSSLFMDHVCDRNEFPLRTSIELSHNDGEVWYVSFSHNGKFLATCGQSSTVLIYETRTFEVRHRLFDHHASVVYTCWSPDDSKLITCSQDAKARIWDVATGRCIQVIDHQEQAVTTAAWTPDGLNIVTGSLDKHAQLCLRSVDGKESFSWPSELRTQDCAITPDGGKLIVMSSECYVTVYNLSTKVEEYSIKVSQRMTCINVSQDSRTMLINMANDEIHLIDIETANIIRKYTGQHQQDFVIRSAFGGADEGLIVSGSSNSKIYIWHKENGTLIETLEGHNHGCVNTVSWNPANPTMFASGGDDRKVRIWSKSIEASAALRRRVSSQSSHRSHHHERII